MIWQPSTSIWTPPTIGPLDIPPSPPAERRRNVQRESDRDTRPLRNRRLCPGAWQEWAECVRPVARRRAMAPSGAAANSLSDAAFYYKFESNSWLDSTSGGNNLTGSGSPTSNTGKIGNALYSASASSQFLKHVDASAFDMSGTSFTLTCWAYATTLPSFTALVSKVRTSSVAEYYLFNDGSSTWYFAIFNSIGNTDDAIWAGTAPSTATWYWLEAFKDTTNNIISINVNNGTAATAASSKPITHQTTAQFGIGARVLAGAGDSYWDGRIDSVGGWKRLLTPTERATLYNAGAGSDPF